VPDNQESSQEGVEVLARYVVGSETLAATLERVTHLAARVVPADMAGITMLVEGRPTTAIFTDLDAPRIDAHQYNGTGGPCMTAFKANRAVRIGSVPDDERWPDFTRVAGEFGIRSTLSLPLSTPGKAWGALNLYSYTPNAFGLDQEQIGADFAEQAAVVLANARVHQDAQELNENLHQALTSRATIDYAIGILMAQSGHTSDEAFGLLVRASQRQNRKLRVIAAEVVDRALKRGGSVGPSAPADGSGGKLRP
jgi:GAF domain-containing protein